MQSKQMIIGITGGIGSGKSAVSNILKQMGYPVVDADIIARTVLDKGTAAYDKTVETFGTQILLEDFQINRARLGEIIFNDALKREKLNSIVHPAVYEAINCEVSQLLKSYELVFVDVPLLFENNRAGEYDEVWVVNASDTVRIKRICKRDHVDEAYAIVKINAQMPLEEKTKFATRVIENDGSLESLKHQVVTLINSIKK
ncbi:dephospho-CoA kinase [Fusibacter ferrireducens]|uniref:Dephospho-CoA kinase n=1 Tax=Fusibacter ferrireducens TaxID=2785058 RepID=A0ABR9ZY83_9FIRM|nr:dephospho-CoA kinase [Fusibacter ferrireducens]MBF4694845.1 dephospho-CoA kinase [Fusibacter ferrireducens]